MIQVLGIILLLICVGATINGIGYLFTETSSVMQQQYVLTNQLLIALSLIGVMLAVGLHTMNTKLDKLTRGTLEPTSPFVAPESVEDDETGYKSLLH